MVASACVIDRAGSRFSRQPRPGRASGTFSAARAASSAAEAPHHRCLDDERGGGAERSEGFVTAGSTAAARGVASPSVMPSAHLIASKYICATSRLSHVLGGVAERRSRRRGPCRSSSPTRAANRRPCGAAGVAAASSTTSSRSSTRDLVARVLLRLIELVGERERRREMLRRGKVGRLVDDRARRAAPRMAVVAGAEQLAELRPRLERGQRRVRRDESLALVAHERQQLGLLLHRRSAPRGGRGRKSRRRWRGSDRRSPARRSSSSAFGDDVRVGADEGVVRAGLVAEPLDHRRARATPNSCCACPLRVSAHASTRLARARRRAPPRPPRPPRPAAPAPPRPRGRCGAGACAR